MQKVFVFIAFFSLTTFSKEVRKPIFGGLTTVSEAKQTKIPLSQFTQEIKSFAEIMSMTLCGGLVSENSNPQATTFTVVQDEDDEKTGKTVRKSVELSVTKTDVIECSTKKSGESTEKTYRIERVGTIHTSDEGSGIFSLTITDKNGNKIQCDPA